MLNRWNSEWGALGCRVCVECENAGRGMLTIVMLAICIVTNRFSSSNLREWIALICQYACFIDSWLAQNATSSVTCLTLRTFLNWRCTSSRSEFANSPALCCGSCSNTWQRRTLWNTRAPWSILMTLRQMCSRFGLDDATVLCSLWMTNWSPITVKVIHFVTK